MNEKNIRSKIFWSLISLLSVLILIGHGLESRLRYPLLAFPDGQPASMPLQTGSFGFYIAEIPEIEKKYKKILVLGNSVYHNFNIIEKMQQQSNGLGNNLAFINASQVGSGIHDHILQLGKAVKSQPDLIVVGITNLAFSPDHIEKNSQPKFRTDAPQMAFDLDVMSVVPYSFYNREFDLNFFSNNAISSIFPIKRLDWYLRTVVDRKLQQYTFEFPSLFRKAFPLPRLNIALDWLIKNDVDLTSDQNIVPAPYENADELLGEFLSIAKMKEIPVLFIRLASAPKFRKPNIMPMLNSFVERESGFFAVDYQDNFTELEYPDGIHPQTDRTQTEVAKRHFSTILTILQKKS